MKIIIILASLFGVLNSASANDSWICDEAASIRNDELITACGIAQDKDEDKARKSALENAFRELDMVCNRSADCRDFELNITPMRNECQKQDGEFRCHRAIHAEITATKKAKVVVENPGKQLAPEPDRASALTQKEATLEERATEYHCDYDTDKAIGLFSDLSSSTTIAAAVQSAKLIPFRKSCRDFHFRVIETLSKEKVFSKEYNKFLLTTVKAFGSEDEMKDADIIWEYLAEQGFFDEHLWRDALNTFVHLPKKNDQIARFVPILFQPNETSVEHKALTLAHLDQVMTLAKAAKIGRPTPLKPDDAFMEIIKGLSFHTAMKGADESWLRRSFFEKYLTQAPIDKAGAVNDNLERLLRETKDQVDQTHVIQWIALNLNRGDSSKIPFRIFPSFLEHLDHLQNQTDANADKALYIKLVSKRMDEVFAALTESFEIESATQTCLKYEIPCPSLIPNEQDVRKIFTDGTRDKQLLALTILAKRPALAAPLETMLYQNLLDEEHKEEHRYEFIQGYSEALMHIPTKDPKIIRHLLAISLERQISYEKLILAIGPPATKMIVEIAQDPKHPNQNTAVEMLKIAAKKDPSARLALKDIAEHSSNEYMKRAASEALERLQAN